MAKNSSWPVICLGNKGPLNGTKLILDDHGNNLDSFRICLESFRSFRGPLFHKPVTGHTGSFLLFHTANRLYLHTYLVLQNYLAATSKYIHKTPVILHPFPSISTDVLDRTYCIDIRNSSNLGRNKSSLNFWGQTSLHRIKPMALMALKWTSTTISWAELINEISWNAAFSRVSVEDLLEITTWARPINKNPWIMDCYSESVGPFLAELWARLADKAGL